ncbi:MAG: flagellar hook-length control protein FliK, partial [Pseudomonadota bacterium]
ARISLNQLSSHPVDESANRVWQLELPVLHNGAVHTLKLRIEEDHAHRKDDPAEAEKSWRVSLSMQLPSLGKVQVSLLLQGKTMEIGLSAERKEVRALLDMNHASIQAAVAAEGIDVKMLSTAPLPSQPDAQPGDTASAGLSLKA